MSLPVNLGELINDEEFRVISSALIHGDADWCQDLMGMSLFPRTNYPAN